MKAITILTALQRIAAVLYKHDFVIMSNPGDPKEDGSHAMYVLQIMHMQKTEDLPLIGYILEPDSEGFTSQDDEKSINWKCYLINKHHNDFPKFLKRVAEITKIPAKEFNGIYIKHRKDYETTEKN